MEDVLKMAQDKLIELRKVVKTPRIILGVRRTLANLKSGKIASVYVAKNAPQMIISDVEHFAKFSDAQVVKLDIESDELGIVCKRLHTVSVVGVLKR